MLGPGRPGRHQRSKADARDAALVRSAQPRLPLRTPATRLPFTARPSLAPCLVGTPRPPCWCAGRAGTSQASRPGSRAADLALLRSVPLDPPGGRRQRMGAGSLLSPWKQGGLVDSQGCNGLRIKARPAGGGRCLGPSQGQRTAPRLPRGWPPPRPPTCLLWPGVAWGVPTACVVAPRPRPPSPASRPPAGGLPRGGPAGAQACRAEPGPKCSRPVSATDSRRRRKRETGRRERFAHTRSSKVTQVYDVPSDAITLRNNLLSCKVVGQVPPTPLP